MSQQEQCDIEFGFSAAVKRLRLRLNLGALPIGGLGPGMLMLSIVHIYRSRVQICDSAGYTHLLEA